MKNKRVLALILSVGLAAPALMWAQGGPPAAPPSQERPAKRELPPEAKELLQRQREETKALRQKHFEERQALMQKLRQEGKIPNPPQKKSQ
jgi:hypothetical protein